MRFGSLDDWRYALKRFLISLRSPALGTSFALLAGVLVLLAVGERPGVLFEGLYNVFFTSFGLGYTLYYATPLIFTGLSVAMAFRCGLFNIGAEGQLYLGSVGVILVSLLLPNAPAWIAVPLGILAAMVFGGIWGAIPGFLKAKRGSHEVITTILLNFIGLAIVDYLIVYPLDNPLDQTPETVRIPAAYQIPSLNDVSSWVGLNLFASTPVNVALLLAIIAAGLCYLFLFYTPRGFAFRSVGLNPIASRFAGISVASETVFAFGFAGALAGMVAINEVMGHQHRLILGFSPQYGFTGIAVALLARAHPIGVIFSAILFGALHNSARELEFLSDKVSKELSFVLQGVLIAFVAARDVFDRFFAQRSKRRAARSNASLPTPEGSTP